MSEVVIKVRFSCEDDPKVIVGVRRWDKFLFEMFPTATRERERCFSAIWSDRNMRVDVSDRESKPIECSKERSVRDVNSLKCQSVKATPTAFIRSAVLSISSWHGAASAPFVCCSWWRRVSSLSSKRASFPWDSCVWMYFSNSRWTSASFSSILFSWSWYALSKSLSNCRRCSFYVKRDRQCSHACWRQLLTMIVWRERGSYLFFVPFSSVFSLLFCWRRFLGPI